MKFCMKIPANIPNTLFFILFQVRSLIPPEILVVRSTILPPLPPPVPCKQAHLYNCLSQSYETLLKNTCQHTGHFGFLHLRMWLRILPEFFIFRSTCFLLLLVPITPYLIVGVSPIKFCTSIPDNILDTLD